MTDQPVRQCPICGVLAVRSPANMVGSLKEAENAGRCINQICPPFRTWPIKEEEPSHA
jgi:hypothetical protein